MTREPRQQRARDTRRRVLAAVADLVAAAGGEAVTTTAVARRAGVAVGTVYRYFATREDLLGAAHDAAFETVVARWFDAMGDLSGHPPEAAAEVLMRGFVETARGVPGFPELLAAVRAIRPGGVEAARQAARADRYGPFAAALGLEPSERNLQRMALLRHVTTDLAGLYLLAPPERAAIVHEETVAMVATAIGRMRSDP